MKRRATNSALLGHDTVTQAYLGVPIDSEDYDFAQHVYLDLVGAFLERIAKILC